jgi:hypothetical protein
MRMYASPNIIGVIKSRRMRWVGHVARIGEMRNTFKILFGGPEGMRLFRRPRRRWEDNIRMDLREIGWDVDWIYLAQNMDRWWALVNVVMNLRVL